MGNESFKKIQNWCKEHKKDLQIMMMYNSRGVIAGKSLTLKNTNSLEGLIEELTWKELEKQHPNRNYFYKVEIDAVRQQVREELFL